MPSTHVSLTYHCVFSTKNRIPLIAKDWREMFYEYLGGCIREAGGVSIEIGGTADHVHVLAGLKATHSLADFLRDVKRATSSWVRQSVSSKFAWQEGYGAFTVAGHECADLIRYIRGQEEHHRVRTFQEEYRDYLARYGVAFDERYLW